MIWRGGVYWVELGAPVGSRPAKRRPVLVVQAHAFNASRLRTVVGAVVTSNTALAAMPGNVFSPERTSACGITTSRHGRSPFAPAAAWGLPRDSVINVTALVTVDKDDLDGPVGQLPEHLMREVDRGLTGVLGL